MAHDFQTVTTCGEHFKQLPEPCRQADRCCYTCHEVGEVQGCPNEEIWARRCAADNLRFVVYSVACEVKRKHVAVLTDEELTYCVGDKRVSGSKSKMKLIDAEARKRWRVDE